MERVRTGAGRGGAPVLPVILHDAGMAGPAAVVTANVHGDETVGIAAIHELDRRVPAWLARGRVALWPSVNAGALQSRTRTNPEDGADLNRSFPGDERGGPSARLAARVWAEIGKFKPNALIDLHADSASAVPYAIVDRAVNLARGEREEMDRQLLDLAAATGLRVLEEYPDEMYVRFGLDRSLAGACVNRGRFPAVTVECGPRRIADPAAVETAVQAVFGVLGALGMLRPGGSLPARSEARPLTRASAPRVGQSGLFVPRIPAGTAFAAGEVLGEIRDLDGGLLESLRAEGAGVLISWAEGSWVDPGGVVGTLGLRS